MKFWTSTGVKCPFYAGEDGRVVHCDVPCEGGALRVHVWLGTGKRKQEHKDKYCKVVPEGYEKCPIYAAAAKGDK